MVEEGREGGHSRVRICEIRGRNTNSPGHGWRGSDPRRSCWITPWTSWHQVLCNTQTKRLSLMLCCIKSHSAIGQRIRLAPVNGDINAKRPLSRAKTMAGKHNDNAWSRSILRGIPWRGHDDSKKSNITRRNRDLNPRKCACS